MRLYHHTEFRKCKKTHKPFWIYYIQIISECFKINRGIKITSEYLNFTNLKYFQINILKLINL